MRRKISRFSVTLEKILKECGMQSRLYEYRIFSRWERIVGRAIARHARPNVLRGRKLLVVVDSSAWMHQLTLMKADMLASLSRELGGDMVRELAFTLGEVHPITGASTDEIIAPVEITSADREAIEAHVRDIGDNETREALRSLLEKEVSSRKRTAGRGKPG